MHFLCSSIEYTHISISIFDNLKYILKKEKEAALYLGVRCSFIFLLSTMNDCKCVAFLLLELPEEDEEEEENEETTRSGGRHTAPQNQTSTKLRPPFSHESS